MAIIGITGGEVPAGSDFTIADWKTSLHNELTALEKKSDLLLLLSSLKMEENIEIAGKFPAIDMVVSTCGEYGNTTKFLDQARHTPLLIQVAGEGRMLGQLQITWQPAAKDGWRELQDESPETLQQRINTARQRTALLEKKLEAGDENENLIPKINREKRLIAQLESRRQQIVETGKLITQKRVNGFSVRFRKILPKPGSQEIIRLIDRIAEKIERVSSH